MGLFQDGFLWPMNRIKISTDLLQHSGEDDADQIITVLVLELPFDIEAETGVPGGDRQLDVISVLFGRRQRAGGSDVSGFTGFALGNGERNGKSANDSVDVGVDGGGSSGRSEFDDHGGVFSLGKKARSLGAAVDINGGDLAFRTAVLVRGAGVDNGQKAKEDGDGGIHDAGLWQF